MNHPTDVREQRKAISKIFIEHGLPTRQVAISAIDALITTAVTAARLADMERISSAMDESNTAYEDQPGYEECMHQVDEEISAIKAECAGEKS